MLSKVALMMILFCGSSSDSEKKNAERELESIFMYEGVYCPLWSSGYNLDEILRYEGCTDEEYYEVWSEMVFRKWYEKRKENKNK